MLQVFLPLLPHQLIPTVFQPVTGTAQVKFILFTEDRMPSQVTANGIVEFLQACLVRQERQGCCDKYAARCRGIQNRLGGNLNSALFPAGMIILRQPAWRQDHLTSWPDCGMDECAEIACLAQIAAQPFI